MKNKLFYILCGLFCLSVLSCSDDEGLDNSNKNEIFVLSQNATIKNIVIRDKDGEFYNNPQLNTNEFTYNIGTRDSIYITATASVDKYGSAVITSGATIGNDGIVIIYKDGVENASAGHVLKIEGPMINRPSN